MTTRKSLAAVAERKNAAKAVAGGSRRRHGAARDAAARLACAMRDALTDGRRAMDHASDRLRCGFSRKGKSGDQERREG
jgi:hypothetical protein